MTRRALALREGGTDNPEKQPVALILLFLCP